MKLIPVYGGSFAKVDDEDFDSLSALRWHLMGKGNTSYAVTNVRRPDGRYSTVPMHRMVNKTPKGMMTDHIDGDGLNNTRANLRTATSAENGRNRMPNRSSTSPFKGVCWNKRRSSWTAAIRVNGKAVYLGQFDNEADAAHAYDAAAVDRFGEFARTNQKRA